MEWVADHSTIIGLVFFFAIFLATLCWLYRPSNKEHIEQLKNIPLEEDNYDAKP